MLILFLSVNSVLFGQELKLDFSHNSGLYDEGIAVEIKGNFDKVYYTLNGSNPKDGRRYKGPIKIKKNTVIRAIPYLNGKRLDTLFLKSYLFNFKTDLPIVSIAMEDSSLWSQATGIYAKGNNAFYNDSTEHWENCNFQQKWEREMHVEYIHSNKSTVFSQPAGIRIFGETTRRQSEKSFKIVARSEYGKNRFHGSVFPLKPHLDEHKQFVLRCSGNDYRGTRFKDCLNAYLVRDKGLDYMAYQPVQLFINGEYWGVYNLREKVNKHYLCYNRNADMDSSSIIMGRWVRQHGSTKDYMRMYRFFEGLDTMDNRAFRKAGEMLDLRNYIDFRTIQTYLNNSDSRGNIRYWNSKDLDGKFRMIFYDTDHSHGSYDRNYLQGVLSTSATHWYNPKWSTMYLTKLMQHPDFKADFVNQFAHHLNTILHPDTINAAVDKFVAVYKDELPRDEDMLPSHFKKSALSEEEWLKNVSKIRKFARLRHNHMYKELKRLLAPKGTYVLKIEGEGRVIINGNNPIDLPFIGTYFREYDLPIRMEENENWSFNSWEDNSTDPNRVISGARDTLVLNASMTFTTSPVEEVQEVQESTLSAHKNESSDDNQFNLEQVLLYIGYGLIGLGLILLAMYFIRWPRVS